MIKTFNAIYDTTSWYVYSVGPRDGRQFIGRVDADNGDPCAQVKRYIGMVPQPSELAGRVGVVLVDSETGAEYAYMSLRGAK